ncbi:MAG: OmpA family protein [Neomegalonema sp.]|nr:OmpA family protein [Neomegalonema sp.]
MMRIFQGIWICVGFLFLAAPAAAACSLRGQAPNIHSSGWSIEQAMKLHEDLMADASCDEAIKTYADNLLKKRLYRTALDERRSAAKRLEYARLARQIEPHWRVAELIGDLYWGMKNYNQAGKYFLEARALAEKEPPEADIREDEMQLLYRKMAETLPLMSTPPAASRASDAQAGALLKPSIRGFKVAAVNVPITFKSGTAEPDELGEAWLEEFIAAVKAQGERRVVLAGHTDPVGSEANNLKLSLRRAEAVAAALRQSGYDGEIMTEGHGEEQVPPPPAGISADSEEHYRLARRVEWKQ